MLSQGEILRNPSRTRFQKPIVSRAPKTSIWSRISYFMTFLIFDCVLSCFGMKTPEIRQAWREKVALCMCIAFCCSCLAFFTYGMNRYVCRASNQFVFGKLDRAEFEEPVIITNGSIYYIDSEKYGRDSIYSGVLKIKSDACKKAFGKQLVGGSMDPNELRRIAPISLEWGYIRSNRLIVIDNEVFDPSLCKEDRYDEFISKYAGGEAHMEGFTPEEVRCFKESFKAGEVATKTPGCLIADTFLYISTVIIFSLIIAKFFLATVYSWYMKGRVRPSSCVTPCILLVTCYSEGREGIKNTLDSLCKQYYDYDNKLIIIIADGEITGENEDKTTPEIILDLCDVDRTNVEPKGYISLMPGNKRHNRAKVYAGYYNVKEVNTVNLFGSEADDCKNNIRTRVLVINKCGNSSETFKAGNRGKRDSQVILMSFFSKLIYSDRMSELDFEIYMKIKELMPHMDPSDFECLLMIDADTIVKPDALSKMVSIFETDPKVMGICGETMILNKCESWVTMIQVFEYYISHHLSKTFESVFGGVTCLPGCFCMYRIKIVTDENGNIVNGYKENRKEIFAGDNKQRFCLPILANQFIINAYSVFEAKTLHQKNLLHLGEDRYLTTLLLKNFYKRKTIFVPQAKCETYVPSEFKVLLSQRRRWINSTIHNLFELVIVDKLCGAFCCSMQFVVLVELFGTLVLPAAVLFTGVLIFSSIVNEPAWIPLIMLACIFGLPAVLIMVTTFKITYIFWLLIYIISIPIWNFVLPVYAFWHFDDFSWGDTRKVSGEENKDEIREIDNSKIRLRELEDYLKEHRNEN